MYIRYRSYLYDYEQNLRDSIYAIRAKINPKNATLRSLASFIEDFEFLIFEFVSYFNFDLSSIKDMNTPSMLKHKKKGIIVEMEHSFNNYIQPIFNKTR